MAIAGGAAVFAEAGGASVCGYSTTSLVAAVSAAEDFGEAAAATGC
ncbi:MAG: hypothetical protein WBY73_16880 [Candidatus Acidiferrales bacterium]